MSYIGTNKIKSIYIGTNKIKSVYVGTSKVYSSIPQLATPQNVSASGTTISFDAVTNATSYEIFADGVSIGVHSVEEPPVPEGNNLTVTQTYGATQSSNELTLE